VIWNVAFIERKIRYDRCVCGKDMLRCKCRIVNWKYVTVEVTI